MIVYGWKPTELGQPLRPTEWVVDELGPGQVAVRVAGCAVCENDRAAVFETPSAHASLPLGHEISGTVVAAGDRASTWLGRSVIVPVFPPSQLCDGCWAQYGGWICRHPERPDISRTGFASHVIVPTDGLCVVEDAELLEHEVSLSDLAVVAEAVGSPYQAMARAQLKEGECAIVIGVSEPGAMGVQIADVLGAYVVALDTDDDRLARAEALGASFALNIRGVAPEQVSREVKQHVREVGQRTNGWKIFEMTGLRAEQIAARELVTHGGFLALVGASRSDVSVRFSDLVNYVATAQGFCQCMADHLPEALDLVLAGDIRLSQLIDRRPMSSVNQTLESLNDRTQRRPILIPDF